MIAAELRIRHNDYSLDEEHQELRNVVAAFLARACTIDTVHEAEPLGFDAALWGRVAELRPAATGILEARGGDGAGIFEQAMIAEEHGRVIAPVPVVESMVAARALARTPSSAEVDALLAAAIDHREVVTFAPRPLHGSTAMLVPAGACARHVVALHDGELVLLGRSDPPPLAPNRAALPFGWWRPDDGTTRTVLVSDDPARDFALARRDWCILTAAVLVGIAQAALDLGIEHAKEREAFGVPIGSFQAIAHPLVDVATDVVAARRLTHKASWYTDHEPDALASLDSLAFVQAHRAADHGVDVGVHTYGGVGVTVEAPVEQYFRRAKGHALAGGDPEEELQRVADQRYGPRPRTEVRP